MLLLYCEYLIRQAKETAGKEEQQQLLGELFFANYGLVLTFEQSFKVQNDEREDFEQLCYLALVQAFNAYQLGSKNSFLSYYRRCILHQFYVYKLEMRYPVKMPREEFRAVENGELEVSLTDCQFNYGDLDDNLLCVEETMMSDVVWGEVEQVLAWNDVLLLKRRFCDEATYKELAEEFGVDPNTLRFKQHRLLIKLKKDTRLHEIARDFYGIR